MDMTNLGDAATTRAGGLVDALIEAVGAEPCLKTNR